MRREGWLEFGWGLWRQHAPWPKGYLLVTPHHDVAKIFETEGVYLGDGGLSAESVRDHWAQIEDQSGQKAYYQGGEQTQKFFRKMSGG